MDGVVEGKTLSPSYILKDRNRATLGLLGLGYFGGGPYGMPASVNQFMEAGSLR
jgi:hypothetical protein